MPLLLSPLRVFAALITICHVVATRHAAAAIRRHFHFQLTPTIRQRPYYRDSCCCHTALIASFFAFSFTIARQAICYGMSRRRAAAMTRCRRHAAAAYDAALMPLLIIAAATIFIDITLLFTHITRRHYDFLSPRCSPLLATMPLSLLLFADTL